ncbi:MAG TPA: carboxypeptidase-like regulatory domain-containing protein [Planctomycetota bacterium]|nr:carboxypeptidase-like regulatory domain-containing protein [Planctomycetota bacterium]
MQRSTVLFLLLAAGGAAALSIGTWPASTELPSGAPASPQPPAAEGPGREPPPASAAPRVRVEVRALERYVAPPPLRVQAVRLADAVELPTELLAGAGAGFDAGPPRPGLALVRIGYEAGSLLRQVPVVEAPVATSVGARIVCRGRVRDAGQKAVEGARVWLGEQDGEGHDRVVYTDADGVFELDAPAGDGVPFVVQAEGRASTWRAVTVAAPMRELDVTLQPAGRLEVQLAGTGQGIEAARLFVLPGATVSTEVAQYPFFLQVLTRGFAIDERGRALVADLPQGGQLGLFVQHARLAGTVAHAVVLAGRQTRAVVPFAFVPSLWRGRVVDTAGEPLAGVRVWSRPPGADLAPGGSPRLLPPHLEARGVCMAETDAEGGFEIGASAVPDAVLSLRMLGHAGRDVTWSTIGTEPLVLPPWTGDEAAFRLLPPVAGIAWRAECDLAGGIAAELAADRPWLVAFPHAGRFEVVVTTFVGDREARRSFAGVDATGTVELPAPLPE